MTLTFTCMHELAGEDVLCVFVDSETTRSWPNSSIWVFPSPPEIYLFSKQ